VLFEKPTAYDREHQVKRKHIGLIQIFNRSVPNCRIYSRSILINWLLAVIDEFQQDDDIIFLPLAHHQTVALFDRYCSEMKGVVQTNELQMIGAACAVIAMNSIDDIHQISMSCFQRASFYTDGACTAEQIMDTSTKISNVLHLRSVPSLETACEQIDSLLAAMQKNYPSSSTYCLSHYLGELALQAETSLKFRPHVLGSAAYALACHTLGWAEAIWMPIIRNKTNGIVSITQLQPCMSELQGLLRQALGMLTRRGRPGNLPHVIVKYSRRERQHVAKVIVTPTPWPAICPHGQERAGGCCAHCEDEEAAACAHHFSRRSTLDSDRGLVIAGSRSSHQIAGSIGDNEQIDANELSAIFEAETSRDDVQTPVNTPHHIEIGATGAAFQRGLSKQAVPSIVPLLDSHSGAQQSLQDVSFGAISDGNDNSFIVCPESVFDEDLLLAGDRRASLTSVLDAVDEEDAFRSGHSKSQCNDTQDDLDISFDVEKDLLILIEAEEDGQLAIADPDMARLTLR
jgi:hypothetical protein